MVFITLLLFYLSVRLLFLFVWWQAPAQVLVRVRYKPVHYFQLFHSQHISGYFNCSVGLKIKFTISSENVKPIRHNGFIVQPHGNLCWNTARFGQFSPFSTTSLLQLKHKRFHLKFLLSPIKAIF